MANTPQARKRVRQTERRTAVNRARVGRIRTYVKRVEQAIAAGDKAAAQAAFKEAQPELSRGVRSGTLRRHTAARKISRLAQHIKGM